MSFDRMERKKNYATNYQKHELSKNVKEKENDTKKEKSYENICSNRVL